MSDAHALPVTPYPAVGPGDRLGLTLFLAILVHAILVLGVTFTPEPRPRLRTEGLEVTLVTQKDEEKPDQPELLAQANNQGGGDATEPARPASPLLAPLPAPVPALAAAAPPPSPPPEQRLPLEPLARAPQPAPAAEPTPAREPAPEPAPAPTRPTLVKPVPVAKLRAAPAPKAPPEPAETAAPAEDAPAATTAPAPELPTAQELIARSFAMASLHAELQQKLENKASRPRTKFVSATTQEYKYAAYMEAWRAKVERVGNLNYPDEARRRKLSGALLLDVALKPDGSVLEIIVRRSSGHRVLDDAAVRIVELAGPFAPFPAEIRRDVDVLHVTRTWKFLSSERFQAQ